ncbi:MAG: hypothetical protein HYT81_08155, partial [Gemmatimonadetes bacterium]|nr:hypothetical protein [Gemmatimonadota bacterium]
DSLESLSLPFALQARADLAVGSLSSRPLSELRVLDALARPDREAERALAPELRSATFPRLHAIAWRAAVYLHDIAGASRIARFLVQPQRDRANRLNGRELLAYLHLAQGRWRAARAELDSLESLSLPFALQARADLAVGSLSSRPLSELRAVGP